MLKIKRNKTTIIIVLRQHNTNEIFFKLNIYTVFFLFSNFKKQQYWHSYIRPEEAAYILKYFIL